MSELHLRVYDNRSELVLPDGTATVFKEGGMNQDAKIRYGKINQELSNNYLENQILVCRDRSLDLDFSVLQQDHRSLLENLVQSITSETGRALVGVSILQLCIKAIEPQQNVRLHKGSIGKKDFSWCDGISMRSLDSSYITPILRKYELLTLSKFGFMMTRSLAENYPYSKVYKANMRGARREWMNLVELIEEDGINADLALKYTLTQLLNQADNFKKLSLQVVEKLKLFVEYKTLKRTSVLQLILDHIKQSDYAARLMEIAMHVPRFVKRCQSKNLLSVGLLHTQNL